MHKIHLSFYHDHITYVFHNKLHYHPSAFFDTAGTMHSDNQLAPVCLWDVNIQTWLCAPAHSKIYPHFWMCMQQSLCIPHCKEKDKKTLIMTQTNLCYRLLPLREWCCRDDVDCPGTGVSIWCIADLHHTICHLVTTVAICTELVLDTNNSIWNKRRFLSYYVSNLNEPVILIDTVIALGCILTSLTEPKCTYNLVILHLCKFQNPYKTLIFQLLVLPQTCILYAATMKWGSLVFTDFFFFKFKASVLAVLYYSLTPELTVHYHWVTMSGFYKNCVHEWFQGSIES